MKRLAIVGAGMMGEALARGLVAAGWTGGDIVMADIRADRLDELSGSLDVATTTDAADACRRARGVLLATKPQDAAGALEQVGRHVGPDGMVSIAAGLTTSAIEHGLGGGASVVRAMPNTPVRVGKGVTALAAGSAAVQETRDLAQAIFSAVGPVVWLEEDLLDAVTAVSGSGPAYVFFLAEAMQRAAAELGLPADVATALVSSTIEGAGAMLRLLGSGPEELRAQVTSPGGTTAAAVAVLEERKVHEAFVDALRAARDRSRELGGGPGAPGGR